ncbi:MAG: hypothetical protein CMJ28_00810 [Phycisphaerae bacterium]|nr:hypothetical protein [Phycisphaerae bacterium]
MFGVAGFKPSISDGLKSLSPRHIVLCCYGTTSVRRTLHPSIFGERSWLDDSDHHGVVFGAHRDWTE